MQSMPSRTERTVTAGGLKLFVREQGAGYPLLMINGIGANTEMWGAAEEILARGSRTIAFDCPGTGRSEMSFLPLQMPGLANVVVSALDELGYDRVDVLGFSFGGALAQQFAHDALERVRRLALVSTGCGWGSTPGSPPALSALANPLRYFSRSWYELACGLLGEDDSAGAAKGPSESLSTALGYTYQLWALATWSSHPWLHRLEAPTLVVSGGRDRLVPPRNAVQLARLLQTSRLHVLPDAAHLLMNDSDGAASRLLSDFFSSPVLGRSTAWTTGRVLGSDAWEQAA
jgi:pimeloyl-ACP methyl ester carboxylesterase